MKVGLGRRHKEVIVEEKLQRRLEKFEVDTEWSGMKPEDMIEVTEYTLEALSGHLEEDIEHGHSEASVIKEALGLVQTHCLG